MDHSLQSALFGDDRNTVSVRGWGRGQLNLRAAYTTTWQGWRAEVIPSSSSSPEIQA